MKPSREIEKLAEQMAARHNGPSPGPYLLFLGTGCAHAAGVPSTVEMARAVMDDLRQGDPETLATLLPEGDRADAAHVEAAFLNLLGGMPGIQRYKVLRRFYERVPVPLFYQDLAVLIKAGYFTHILTTNIDRLLERALEGAGLRATEDYQVIVLSVPSEERYSSDRSHPVVSIVKLHGDLGQSQIVVGPEEIEATLRMERSRVRSELKGDMIIAGYEFESDPIERWLSKSQGGELWWVSAERPASHRVRSIESTRVVEYLDGENGHPEAFFAQLASRLLRLPVLQSMLTPVDTETEPLPIGSITVPQSEGHLQEMYLWGELRRAQAVLNNLLEQIVLGEKNVALEAQLEYQRQKVAELEDQVRGLEPNKVQVVHLMEEIGAAVQTASTDPRRNDLVDQDTLSFLQSQVNAVTQESRKGVPNQHVVSGAVSAAVVVALRLGAKVVEPPLVRALAAFMPRIRS